MAWYNKINMSSKAQASGATYPENTRRAYLFIVAVAELTVAVGGGDAFTIPAGGHWAPHICPTSPVVITGSCVVTTDTAHP
jgi:hypothetical protein